MLSAEGADLYSMANRIFGAAAHITREPANAALSIILAGSFVLPNATGEPVLEWSVQCRDIRKIK